jgi:drug/metabolite transporter (DMT)-like permease
VTLQFLALRRGSLVVVQALLVSGLLFALPLGAALHRRWLSATDWLGAVAVVAGLAVFVTVAHPAAGREPSGVAWVVVLTLGLGVVATLIAAAPRHPGARRGTYLGTACGALYGVNAGLVKATGHLLDRGALHALQAWEPYAVVVLGASGFLLAQSAFQAGPLGASLPAITAADPIVASLVAVLAFQERIAGGGATVALQVGAGVAIAAGVWVLARSPLVAPAPALPSRE